MRTSTYLMEKRIGYDTFHYLCQYLHIETPRLNGKLTDKELSDLNQNIDSEEFIEFLKSNPIGLPSKPHSKPYFDTSKVKDLINEFKKIRPHEISDELAKQILTAVGYKLNLLNYTEENYNKIREIFIDKISPKEKLQKLISINYFTLEKEAKPLKSRVVRRFYADDDWDSEAAIMRALIRGDGDLYGLG